MQKTSKSIQKLYKHSTVHHGVQHCYTELCTSWIWSISDIAGMLDEDQSCCGCKWIETVPVEVWISVNGPPAPGLPHPKMQAGHVATNQSIANHMSAQVKIVLKAILQTFHDTCIPTIMHIHAYNINFNHEFARSSRSKILLFVVGSSTYRTALCISKSLRYGSLLSHQALKLIKVEALEAAGSVLHLTQKSNPKGSVKVILNLYYT